MADFGNCEDLFAQGGGFDMPSTWTLGVAFKPMDALTLMFDVQEVKYADVDSVANPTQNLFNCPIFNPAGRFENCRGGYSMTDQPIPSDQLSLNILAPGLVEQHFTAAFTRTRSSGNELNFSFMYAPEETVRGPDNFDPSQTVEVEMTQFEFAVSYSWKR